MRTSSPPSPADRLDRWRHGPPHALPRPLDATGRWWAARTARERLALGVVAAVALLLALTLGARQGVPGPPRQVLVVVGPAAAGTPAAAVVVEPRRREADGVPDDAVAPADHPGLVADGRLAVGLLGGEVLRHGHLRAEAPHEQLAEGRVAVLVRLSGPAPPTGSAVDLLDTAGVPDGARVAVSARVLALDGDETWLDVDRDEAAAVTAAGAAETLAAARLPP